MMKILAKYQEIPATGNDSKMLLTIFKYPWFVMMQGHARHKIVVLYQCCVASQLDLIIFTVDLENPYTGSFPQLQLILSQPPCPL